MMDYEIEPYVGAGPVRFGMTRDQVRKVLDSEVRPSKKSSSDIPADFFPLLGIFVDYKPPGMCQAVEFAGPASPTFEGQHLLGRPYGAMQRWIATIDPEVLLDDAGLKTKKFGFGLYAPAVSKGPERPVEGVLAFDKGYYKWNGR
jgi:hypothetical protein